MRVLVAANCFAGMRHHTCPINSLGVAPASQGLTHAVMLGHWGLTEHALMPKTKKDNNEVRTHTPQQVSGAAQPSQPLDSCGEAD